jgi:hypothetical protein
MLKGAIKHLGSSYTGLCEDPERFPNAAWTRPQSVERVMWGSLVQLLVLSSSIYATYITPVGGPTQDPVSLAQERLKCAHLLTLLVRNTSDQLDALAGDPDPQSHKLGAEHLCVTTGVSLLAQFDSYSTENSPISTNWQLV